MLGTIERTGAIQERLAAIQEAMSARRAMSPLARIHLRKRFGNYRYDRSPPMAKIIRGLRRCDELSKLFTPVDRDPAVTRSVTAEFRSSSYRSEDRKISIPLVFACKLPAPRVYTATVTVDRESYSVKAIVPHPTPEALTAIRNHGDLFDWCEVWWVPNDVLIEKIPDPDPIVVGAVEIKKDRMYYFELHRWVDETVEVGWWSKEGY